MNIFTTFAPENVGRYEHPAFRTVNEFVHSDELEQYVNKLRQLDTELDGQYVRVEVYKYFGNSVPKKFDGYERIIQIDGTYYRNGQVSDLSDAFELYSKFSNAKFGLTPIACALPWNTEVHGFDASPIFSHKVVDIARHDSAVQQSYSYKEEMCIFAPTRDCRDRVEFFATLKVYQRSDWDANKMFSVVVARPEHAAKDNVTGQLLFQALAEARYKMIQAAFDQVVFDVMKHAKDEKILAKAGLVADIPIDGATGLELKDMPAYGRYVTLGVSAPDWSTRHYMKGIGATRRARVIDTSLLMPGDEINLTFDKKGEIYTDRIERISEEFGVTINHTAE